MQVVLAGLLSLLKRKAASCTVLHGARQPPGGNQQLPEVTGNAQSSTGAEWGRVEGK